jgi:hypothetical protein
MSLGGGRILHLYVGIGDPTNILKELACDSFSFLGGIFTCRKYLLNTLGDFFKCFGDNNKTPS